MLTKMSEILIKEKRITQELGFICYFPLRQSAFKKKDNSKSVCSGFQVKGTVQHGGIAMAGEDCRTHLSPFLKSVTAVLECCPLQLG